MCLFSALSSKLYREENFDIKTPLTFRWRWISWLANEAYTFSFSFCLSHDGRSHFVSASVSVAFFFLPILPSLVLYLILKRLRKQILRVECGYDISIGEEATIIRSCHSSLRVGLPLSFWIVSLVLTPRIRRNNSYYDMPAGRPRPDDDCLD